MADLPPADLEALTAVAQGSHHDPHSVLGPHPLDDGGPFAVVRALRPLADEVSILSDDGEHPCEHQGAGVWTAVVPAATATGGAWAAPDYRVRTRYGTTEQVADDPYRFLPTLGEIDLHLIGEGRHEELWKALGATVRRYPSTSGDISGASFAVWAPNARGVRLLGDHNLWTPVHPMRSLGSSGVWELFVPGITPGTHYKFEVLGADGVWRAKADPMARATELPPGTASIVTESAYEWGDDAWLAARAASDPHSGPMSVYEVHLGSWRPGLSYRELADELTEYVSEQGFTHVEFLPVAEHPFGGSWGYQVTSYYAPTSRFGTPDDFRHLVDRLHQAGIGVLLDWVPAHFPRDEFALARFDGTPLYEHPDPTRGEHQDWGTYIFDFGRREVRNFLVANATYWFEEFHADGLRVDAVASMLYLDYSREPGEWHPNVHGGRENLEAISFLQEANATAYRRTPGVMLIAEESTSYPGVTRPTSSGGLGFGLKWNMGWMNDTLRYLAEDPVNRRYHHHELTFSMVYAFSEQFVLPISHDEVVHGKGSLLRKMPGDRWQQMAGVRSFLAYQWTHPGKQLLFMGCEIAQDTEWSEGEGLRWEVLADGWHAGVQRLVRDLNTLYRATPALWERDFDGSGFEWLDADDADRNLLAYVRRSAAGDPVVVVVNFSGVPHEGYRLPLPEIPGSVPGPGPKAEPTGRASAASAAGQVWREALNTDAEIYGGSGVGNLGRVTAEAVPHYGRDFSASVRVPPLGALILVPEPSGAAAEAGRPAGR
ncbi:1,4-alpha-glucan branching protein GlgB [Myceligenerans xiligouense]|uniref:1,4-alpha-glucan branching enzyme GlgB n=1 Tax=Myceligenerans xiligouense TaxID=253184 RepID=A0A3N4YLK5_9MICO|nr:1,4-alpha-glucan branching protein GlgB [Myceligenerans xiligouense]RPF20204.1 1,4-alpha-glucan branching enzyme [Myceligenerans xiligouense]